MQLPYEMLVFRATLARTPIKFQERQLVSVVNLESTRTIPIRPPALAVPWVRPEQCSTQRARMQGVRPADQERMRINVFPERPRVSDVNSENTRTRVEQRPALGAQLARQELCSTPAMKMLAVLRALQEHVPAIGT